MNGGQGQSDRMLRKISRLFARVLYRSVTVVDPEPGWLDGPALLAVNHFGGFADAALLLGVLRRRPRFLAKSTLWKIRPVGWVLDWAGAVPVYRAVDGATAGNVDTFAACHDALRGGEAVAIFPAGTAHDDPAIHEIRTGAARIALGARAAGVAGLTVVPVGIHFEDKAAMRSRALVLVGDPLDLDAAIGEFVGPGEPESPENREAVQALTGEIDRRLRAAAPDFADRREAELLSFAAGVALRTDGPGPVRPVPFGDRQLVAKRLATRPADERSALVEAAAEYRADLEAVGIGDRELMVRSGGSRPRRRLAATLLQVAVLAPFALAGIVLNAVPYLVVRLVPRIQLASVTLATIKVLVGMVAFGLAWLVWAFVAWRLWEWQIGLAVLVLAPLYGGVAVYVSARVAALVRFWRGRRRRRRLGVRVAGIRTDRQELADAVRASVFAGST